MDLPNLWAITSPALNEIVTSARRTEGDLARIALRQKLLATQAAAGRGTTQAKGGGRLGYIPIFGAISHRGGWYGNTSSVEIIHAVETMSRDVSVAAIVLDIDSPGGTVSGTQEASDAIYAARARKPIVAIANSLAASAAYWIGSSASKFYVAPSGEVGSIGVYAMHLDLSKANERLGVKPTYISAGKYKVEGNPDAPLTAEAKASIQRSVDAAYTDFIRAVARNRGVKLSDVKGGFGEGRVVGSKEAYRLGMVDGVQTFGSVVNIAKNLGTTQGGRQASDINERRARWAAVRGTPSLAAIPGYLQAEKPEHRERLSFLYHSWAAHNATYFGGKLTQPIITVADLSKQPALANCSMFAKPAKIRFDAKYFATAKRESLSDTLLHEMIHQCLGQLFPKQARDSSGNPHHGEFAKICNRIARERGWSDVTEAVKQGKAAAQYWPPRPREYERTK